MGKGGAITDQVHSLSDAISREKIAAFKAKRLAKKRATIKPGDDLAGGPVSNWLSRVSLHWQPVEYSLASIDSSELVKQ